MISAVVPFCEEVEGRCISIHVKQVLNSGYYIKRLVLSLIKINSIGRFEPHFHSVRRWRDVALVTAHTLHI